jgi:hypothetical protein
MSGDGMDYWGFGGTNYMELLEDKYAVTYLERKVRYIFLGAIMGWVTTRC